MKLAIIIASAIVLTQTVYIVYTKDVLHLRNSVKHRLWVAMDKAEDSASFWFWKQQDSTWYMQHFDTDSMRIVDSNIHRFCDTADFLARIY